MRLGPVGQLLRGFETRALLLLLCGRSWRPLRGGGGRHLLLSPTPHDRSPLRVSFSVAPRTFHLALHVTVLLCTDLHGLLGFRAVLPHPWTDGPPALHIETRRWPPPGYRPTGRPDLRIRPFPRPRAGRRPGAGDSRVVGARRLVLPTVGHRCAAAGLVRS
ncbi:hypothetical protein [Nonomuraea diastatica]|uniref:Uncharacterized protein n=1 Tax=Nonomuraea diastatica TaxID=1848329 RepID=A0A4R4WC41_9ACTN|nr:hypothetical protein [Nonomuraea diastatica]TDD16389.1 hypothetical protein E1294_31425 [Nonomuraea diastatica]